MKIIIKADTPEEAKAIGYEEKVYPQVIDFGIAGNRMIPMAGDLSTPFSHCTVGDKIGLEYQLLALAKRVQMYGS